MNNDIMSYCGDGVLDAADKYWKNAKKQAVLRRLTVIGVTALLAAGMIAAAAVAVSKLNSMKPPLPHDTEATAPVYFVTDDEETEAGVPANDGTSAETEEGEETEAGILTETEEGEETEAGILTETEEEGESTGAGTVAGVTTDVPEMTENNTESGYAYGDSGKIGVERPTKGFTDYNEYLDFIAETDHLLSIIEYDSIKAIGKFKSFVLLSYDFSQYMYSFDDGSGFTVKLYVTDTSARKDNNDYQIIDPSDFTDDLRVLRSDVSGVRYTDDIEYMYVHGKLLWISWEEGGIRFTLSGDSMLDGYPHGVNTFTARLLNEQTAAETVGSLKTGG